MSALTTEARIDCPHCGEQVTIVLDLSVSEQTYIEDCYVCCRPINISYTTDGAELLSVTAAADA